MRTKSCWTPPRNVTLHGLNRCEQEALGRAYSTVLPDVVFLQRH